MVTAEGARPMLVSAPEAAAALGISERTVWALVAAGELASVRIGRRRLFPQVALAAFVAARQADVSETISGAIPDDAA